MTIPDTPHNGHRSGHRGQSCCARCSFGLRRNAGLRPGQVPLALDPPIDLVGIEADVAADLEERNAALVNETTDETLANRQSVSQLRHIKQLTMLREVQVHNGTTDIGRAVGAELVKPALDAGRRGRTTIL